MNELTHLDDEGRARMVDVGGKPETARTARAEGSITMSLEALDAIERHALAKGDAIAAARIAGSRLKELVITDSIQPTEAVRVATNIRTLSIASLIAEAISRTAAEESVSSLFD